MGGATAVQLRASTGAYDTCPRACFRQVDNINCKHLGHAVTMRQACCAPRRAFTTGCARDATRRCSQALAIARGREQVDLGASMFMAGLRLDKHALQGSPRWRMVLFHIFCSASRLRQVFGGGLATSRVRRICRPSTFYVCFWDRTGSTGCASSQHARRESSRRSAGDGAPLPAAPKPRRSTCEGLCGEGGATPSRQYHRCRHE